MRKFALCALAAAVLIQPLLAIDLPAPPSGFTWQQVPELKAAFLAPNGWYFRHEEQKGTLAYFITKESIERGSDFSTGLSVNVLRALKDPATDHAKALIEQLAEKMDASTFSRTLGPFYEIGCEARDAKSAMHYLAIANMRTNTLYFFTFESPVADWDAEWKLGSQMMDNLALDDGM